jgi:hypothetical protein
MEMNSRLDGFAVRAPHSKREPDRPDLYRRNATGEFVDNALLAASRLNLKGILAIFDEGLVDIDFCNSD